MNKLHNINKWANITKQKVNVAMGEAVEDATKVVIDIIHYLTTKVAICTFLL